MAPTTTGIELMVLERWAWPGTAQIVVMRVVLAVGVIIHLLNVAAVRHELLPLRVELSRRIAELGLQEHGER